MSLNFLSAQLSTGLRLAYREARPPAEPPTKGIIILLHGFPQTSYQFRHIIPLLAADGYHCIAPDYRGAGGSSKPTGDDFTKTTMARDIISLLDHLAIHEKVHVVGHDLGGMVAYALASRHSARVKSVCLGECPLPGTQTYFRDRTEHAVQQFHFIFHCVPDLPEALIAGKERIYIKHFFDKITYSLSAFDDADVDYYTQQYSQPGAMRCATATYRAFERDAEENKAWVAEQGICQIPTLVLSGEHSRHAAEAMEMMLEVTDERMLRVETVAGAAHFLAEENPKGFADAVLRLIGEHDDS